MPVLSFKGKTAVETYHHTVPHHTLDLDKKLSCLPKGEQPSLDGNLIIEGDNLLALKALLPTHAGRIKCIYIDPPYNTGNEGWVYNDNLTQPQFKDWIGKTVGKEGEDFCRHDKWCCMMYPRLQLLRELLSEDGSIWISIDDNEVHHLRMLLDEIFGVEAFVSSIAWQRRYSVSGDEKGIGAMHEHLIVYSKGSEFQRGLLPRTPEQIARYTNPDDDSRGVWASDNYVSNKSKEERPSLWYPIKHPKTGKDVWPDPNAVWRYSPTKHEQCVRERRLYWGPDLTYEKPRLKRYLSEIQEGVVPASWWPHTDAGHNDEANKELGRILGDKKAFSSPKPVRLIERIIRVAANDPDDIVLDSFAGSGTTAHAVLRLNTEDEGNRRFVLVQQAFDRKDHENSGVNICKTVTRERVDRVILGYTESNGKKKPRIEGLGGSFAYARVSEQPLLGEYRDLGERLPSYDDIAKYVFYTETSTQWDKAGADKGSGKIGEVVPHPRPPLPGGEGGGTSYYLLYRPNRKVDWPIDMDFLKTTAKQDPNRNLVVYCEKIWLHRADLREWEQANNKRVRTMLVPFNLK